MKFTRLRKSEMYEKLFNGMAVATFVGIAFITTTLPMIWEEPQEEKLPNQNFILPDIQVSTPDVSMALRLKTKDDSFGNVCEALSLIETATSVKEPRDFEPFKLVYVGEFFVTMYSATIEQCGSTDGITASGKKVTEDPTCRTVAVDPNVIPLGTKLVIDLEGYESIVWEASDTGGDIKNYWLDLYTDDEQLSKQFNPTYVNVWILEEI